jgi:hypothetical protein
MRNMFSYLLVAILTLSVSPPQTVLRVNGNGSSGVSYVGPASGLPTSCTIGELAVVTDASANQRLYYAYQSPCAWEAAKGSSSGAVPSGSILMVNSGSCPTGYTEDDTFNGNYLLGTQAANSDVGTTGGSNSYTPAGTNGTVTFTPTGSNSSGAFSEGAISWPSGVPTNASGAFSEGAISWPSSVPTIASLSIATTHEGSGTSNYVATSMGGTTLASSTTSITMPAISWPSSKPTIAAGAFTQPTISWPSGVPTIAAGTFTQPTFTGASGTVPAESFTGTGATLTPTYEKVLFCKAP